MIGPDMVTRHIEREVNGVVQYVPVSYMVVKEGDLWDAELIAWANERERVLRAKR